MTPRVYSNQSDGATYGAHVANQHTGGKGGEPPPPADIKGVDIITCSSGFIGFPTYQEVHRKILRIKRSPYSTLL
eukprot:628182-Pyramimonas_sp.AAC.1